MSGYVGEVCRYAHDNTTNVASVTVPVKIAVPAGSRVVVAVGAYPNTAMTGFTCADSKGNSYTQRAFQVHATSSNGNLGVLAANITTALDTTDTLTVGNVSDLRSPAMWLVLAQAFSDLAGFDTSTSATGTSKSPASGSTPAGAQASELVFGAFTASGNPGFTPQAGFNVPAAGMAAYTSTTPRSLAVEWAYVNTTGTRSAPAGLDSSQAWCAACAVWTATAPAASTTRYRLNGSGVWVATQPIRL